MEGPSAGSCLNTASRQERLADWLQVGHQCSRPAGVDAQWAAGGLEVTNHTLASRHSPQSNLCHAARRGGCTPGSLCTSAGPCSSASALRSSHVAPCMQLPHSCAQEDAEPEGPLHPLGHCTLPLCWSRVQSLMQSCSMAHNQYLAECLVLG